MKKIIKIENYTDIDNIFNSIEVSNTILISNSVINIEDIIYVYIGYPYCCIPFKTVCINKKTIKEEEKSVLEIQNISFSSKLHIDALNNAVLLNIPEEYLNDESSPDLFKYLDDIFVDEDEQISDTYYISVLKDFQDNNQYINHSYQSSDNSIDTVHKFLLNRVCNQKTIDDIPEKILETFQKEPLYIDMQIKKEVNDIKKELESLYNHSEMSRTESQSIIRTRIGQGAYREKLIQKYGCQCIICGLRNKKLLIASHIKEWIVSDDNERVDENNGLLLCSIHDALFDKHLISIDCDNKIVLSNQLSQHDIEILNLPDKITYEFSSKTKDYLQYHLRKLYSNE